MSSCKKANNFQVVKTDDFLKGGSLQSATSRTFFFDGTACKKTSSTFFIKYKKQSGLAGGMTVEAAIAVPIFLFFIANLLSLFIMYEQFAKNLAKIHQEGKNLAMIAHSAGDTGGDLVFLIKEQRIVPFVKEIGFGSTFTAPVVYVRKWTGYNVLSPLDTNEEEEYVYITESGTAYHRSRTCSHLKVTINVIDISELALRRNDYGQRYTPCEKCGRGSSTGLIFITNKGDKYHNSASCSGLKRTIKTVKLSEVGGRGPCSLCGGS